MKKGIKQVKDTNKYVVIRRKTGEVVRHCYSERDAWNFAWAFNDLCGNQHAFYARVIKAGA